MVALLFEVHSVYYLKRLLQQHIPLYPSINLFFQPVWFGYSSFLLVLVNSRGNSETNSRDKLVQFISDRGTTGIKGPFLDTGCSFSSRD